MPEVDEVERGVAAFKRGDFSLTIDLLEQASRKYPESYDAFVYLGAACAQLGRHNAAIGAFKRASDIRPDSPRIHYNLGQAYEAAGVPREAWFEYKRAPRNRPKVRPRERRAHLAYSAPAEAACPSDRDRGLTLRISPFCSNPIHLARFLQRLVSVTLPSVIDADTIANCRTGCGAVFGLQEALCSSASCLRARIDGPLTPKGGYLPQHWETPRVGAPLQGPGRHHVQGQIQRQLQRPFEIPTIGRAWTLPPIAN